MSHDELAQACKEVLKKNDKGSFTVPASPLYPHQWLWDSCFIAIGLRHIDIKRAQVEIKSLLRGQWSNGMVPNMVLSTDETSQAGSFWRSSVSPFSPDNVATSGITQPPVIAEAVVRIGEKLDKQERRKWYQDVFHALLAYHQWLYAERDPHQEGLVLQVHPWETGLDNTPPWMFELHQHQMPTWIRIVAALKLDTIIGFFRRDSTLSMPGERLSTLDGLAFYSIQRRLRRKRYDIQSILSHSHLSIEDVTFNAIFIRNNHHLKTIAKGIGKKLPEDLLKRMRQTEGAFEKLWDTYTNQYYSRNFVTHKMIKVPSIGALMPLYGGHLAKERAKDLVKMLTDNKQFWLKYPVPSVPVNSEWFHEHRYWQGPTWINTNWLIIAGLERHGFIEEANHIKEQTIKLVSKNGLSEYFSPKDGAPVGAENFAWTAALVLDMLC
ncbi:glycoside hydrolase [Candidatus Saccharibacteria bacterium]|nr:glycoside hydrolase [Candidatus Saccharibacteria bacterium]